MQIGRRWTQSDHPRNLDGALQINQAVQGQTITIGIKDRGDPSISTKIQNKRLNYSARDGWLRGDSARHFREHRLRRVEVHYYRTREH